MKNYTTEEQFGTVPEKEIKKRHNHDHFWVEDGVLFETYRTIRGLRYNEILKVPGVPDTVKCDELMIDYLSKEFYN